jgi:asparagine synthase (glutamine-hydrolysing)
VVVAQVGEGADELFWGYQQWKNQLKLQNALNVPFASPLSKIALAGLSVFGKGNSTRGEYLRRASIHQPIFWGGAEAFSHRQKNMLLSARLKKQFDSYSSWEAVRPIYERFEQKAWEKKPLNWMTYLDLNLRLPELLLMRVDKMSMGVSLEGRVPFLDHQMVQLAMSIPQAVKTKNGVLKSILKKAVRGVIPDEVIDRPKQGFGVPIYEWFFGSFADTAYQELDQFCKQTDYLDFEKVRLLFEQHQGTQIWFLLNFALWHKEYIGG